MTYFMESETRECLKLAIALRMRDETHESLRHLWLYDKSRDVRDCARIELDRRTSLSVRWRRIGTGLEAVTLAGLLTFAYVAFAPCRAFAADLTPDDTSTGWPIAAMILACLLGLYWTIADTQRLSGDDYKRDE